jgi:hypothetical protein
MDCCACVCESDKSEIEKHFQIWEGGVDEWILLFAQQKENQFGEFLFSTSS